MKYLISKESKIIIDTDNICSNNDITKHVGLFVDSQKDVGRKVKFTNWEPSMGTAKRDNIYTIVGHQMARDYKNNNGEKSMAYRVVCDDEPFGRPAHYYDVEFVD